MISTLDKLRWIHLYYEDIPVITDIAECDLMSIPLRLYICESILKIRNLPTVELWSD